MNTYNPYAPNPYINQPQQPDMGGLNPVFQNIGAQQARLNQAISEGQGLSQQSSQIAGQGGIGGGLNNLAMAALLRKGKPESQENINARDVQMGGLKTYNPYTQYQVSTNYGTDPYSQQSRMLASQEF